MGTCNLFHSLNFFKKLIFNFLTEKSLKLHFKVARLHIYRDKNNILYNFSSMNDADAFILTR